MYGVGNSIFEYIFMIPLETRKQKKQKCKITTSVLQLITLVLKLIDDSI